MPDCHPALGDGEQRVVRAGQGAAAEGDAEGTGAVIGALRDFHRRVHRVARIGGRGGYLEDGEVAGDAAAFGAFGERRGGDVVGDGDAAAVDAVLAEAVLGLVEVQDVAGVVAVAEQHAAAVVGGLRHVVDLLRRRRGEKVSHRRAVREALAHQAGERRVVAGAAADHQRHRIRGALRVADHAAGNALHPAAVGGNQAVDHLVSEGCWFIEEAGHGSSWA